MTACDLVEQLLERAVRPLDPRAAERAARHLATCQGCWSRSGEKRAGDPVEAAPRTAVVVTLACRFCHDPLARGAAVFCAGCLAPHHADCWREHGRCTVLGCGETRSIRPGTGEPPRRPAPAIAAGAALLLVAFGAGGLALVERRRVARLTAQLAAPRAPAPAPAAPSVPPLLSVEVRDASLGELAYEVSRVAGTKVDLPPGLADRLVRRGDWSAARWDRVMAEAARDVGLRVSVDPAAAEVPTSLAVRPGDPLDDPGERAGDTIPVTITQRVAIAPFTGGAGPVDTLHRGHDHRALPCPDGRGVAILDGARLRVVGGGAVWGDGRAVAVPAGLLATWAPEGGAIVFVGARGSQTLSGFAADADAAEPRPAWTWSLFPSPGEELTHTVGPPPRVADVFGGAAAGATWAGPDLVVWTADGRVLRQGGRWSSGVDCEGHGLGRVMAGLPDGRLVTATEAAPGQPARLGLWTRRREGGRWSTVGRWLDEVQVGARTMQVDRSGRLALVTSRREARVLRLPAADDDRSGAALVCTIRASGELGQVALAADGSHVAWVEQGAAFVRDVACRCSAFGPIVVTDDRPVVGVAWSADARALAVRTDLSIGVLEAGTWHAGESVSVGNLGGAFPQGPSRLSVAHAEEGLRSAEWLGRTLIVQASRRLPRRPWLVVRPMAGAAASGEVRRVDGFGVHRTDDGVAHARLLLRIGEGMPRAVPEAEVGSPRAERRGSPFEPPPR